MNQNDGRVDVRENVGFTYLRAWLEAIILLTQLLSQWRSSGVARNHINNWLFNSLSSLFYYTSIIKFIDWNLFSSFDSMDIMLRAFWRSGNFKNTRRWIRGRVLLTGSTGFLGGFLLRDLIRLTKVMNTFKNVIWYLLYFLQINAWSYILKFRFYGQ